jgi:transposase
MMTCERSGHDWKAKESRGAAFKAKVALVALKNGKTLAQLAAQFQVHQSQIVAWKQQLVGCADELFARGAAAEPQAECPQGQTAPSPTPARHECCRRPVRTVEIGNSRAAAVAPVGRRTGGWSGPAGNPPRERRPGSASLYHRAKHCQVVVLAPGVAVTLLWPGPMDLV